MAVVIINLDQFEDSGARPTGKHWVDGLISLSSDFFARKKVYRNYLLLESKALPLKDCLDMLNEASSVDFTYRQTLKSDVTIEVLCAELDKFYDSSIVEP
tara:strand:- start:18517 stop:18816 length:300 start_codon:yes stop_codon:yes gene_type:complete